MGGVLMICENCKKTFESRKNKKYCSLKCNQNAYYKRKTKERTENSAKWKKDNKERYRQINKKSVDKFRTIKRDRFNQLMRDSYHKNKLRWNSRAYVYKIMKKAKRNKLEIEEKCQKCGSTKNLKLKFEIYPNKAREIREAVKNRKIYKLCNLCR